MSKFSKDTEIQIGESKLKVEELLKTIIYLPADQVLEFFKEIGLNIPRELRIYVLRENLREKVAETRKSRLTLADELNYRLSWFSEFTETQLENLLVFFNDENIIKGFLEDFWTNLFAYMVDKEVSSSQLKKLLDASIVYVKENDLALPDIKTYNRTLSKISFDNFGKIDGVSPNKIRNVLYKSSTINEIRDLGLKYEVKVPRRLKKNQLADIIIEELKTQGKHTEELEKQVRSMSVIVMQRFAIDHDIKASTELKKEEVIEYILKNAKETKELYFVPDSREIYEKELHNEEVVTEEVVEEPVEEVVEEPIEETVEEVVEEPIEETVEEVVEEKPAVEEEVSEVETKVVEEVIKEKTVVEKVVEEKPVVENTVEEAIEEETDSQKVLSVDDIDTTTYVGTNKKYKYIVRNTKLVSSQERVPNKGFKHRLAVDEEIIDQSLEPTPKFEDTKKHVVITQATVIEKPVETKVEEKPVVTKVVEEPVETKVEEKPVETKVVEEPVEEVVEEKVVKKTTTEIVEEKSDTPLELKFFKLLGKMLLGLFRIFISWGLILIAIVLFLILIYALVDYFVDATIFDTITDAINSVKLFGKGIIEYLFDFFGLLGL